MYGGLYLGQAAFGEQPLPPPSTVTGAGGIASSETAGSPAVVPGPVVVLGVGGIASDESWGSPSVAPGPVSISGAGGIAGLEALGAPSVQAGAVTISSAGGIASGETVGLALLSGGGTPAGPSTILVWPSWTEPEAEPLWRHFLFDTRTFEDIGELGTARDRQLTLTLNRSGSGNLSLPLDEDIAYGVEKHRTGIRWVRDDKPVWAGPVYTLSKDLAANKLQVGCLGFFEELFRRIVRAGQERTFVEEPQDFVVYALLEMANSQRDGLPQKNSDGTNGTGALRPTKVRQGTAHGNPVFPDTSIQLTRGMKIGEQILQISNNENGLDLSTDPETGELDLWHPRLGRDTELVLVFGDDMMGENLENLVQQLDGTAMTNRLTVFGDNGSVGMAEDIESMDYWGVMFEDESSVSGLATSEAALQFAGAEVAVLKDPRITHVVSLLSSSGEEGGPVPKLFDDFNVGDTMLARGERGSAVIHDQKIRLFGATLGIDDNDNEKLSSIDLAPAI